MKAHRTSMRSPRANSSFKTSETRETYRMAEEIKDILSKAEPMTIFTAKNIVRKGTALGYCRPLVDDERIAATHPYWKILSDMTDPASPLFVNNLEEIDYYNVLCYRLRPDIYRNAKGNWRRVKGTELLTSIPRNKALTRKSAESAE